MVKIGIFFDFHFPSDYLLEQQARKKLRKSMNLLDFITAYKINLKKTSVKSKKNEEKLKKNPQEFKLKTRRGAAFG